MFLPRKFLVVDNNADSRFLLVKTLLRKFPRASIHETDEAGKATALARQGSLDALVVHRATEMDGISLVRELREAAPQIPIVMVSGVDRSQEAIAAGANTFLNYDAWLRIGTVVAELLPRKRSPDREDETPLPDRAGSG